MGVRCDGSKDVLGLWCNDTEGAKFWLSILTELKRRGVEDILGVVLGRIDGDRTSRGGDLPRRHLFKRASYT